MQGRVAGAVGFDTDDLKAVPEMSAINGVMVMVKHITIMVHWLNNDGNNDGNIDNNELIIMVIDNMVKSTY